MADDPKDPSATDEPQDPSTDDLGDAGKKALEAERKARKAAEKSAKDLEARLKAIEDAGKSEVDKLRDERDTAVKERDAARLSELRKTVALRKGLTEAEMKRLSGDSEEDLEADADELLTLTRREEDRGKPPGGKPKEDLRPGGGDPTEDPEEMDPRKLADMVPRF